jgi:hypothetical protein
MRRAVKRTNPGDPAIPGINACRVRGLIDSEGTWGDNRHVSKGRSGTVAPEVQEIAGDLAGDDSEVWTLEDATPQDAASVLSILREVEQRSAGRIRHLTRREARLAAIYQAAGLDPWAAYVAAREYVTLANGGGDMADETLALARSTGEHSMSEPADDAEVDYPAGMIDPFVKNGIESS